MSDNLPETCKYCDLKSCIVCPHNQALTHTACQIGRTPDWIEGLLDKQWSSEASFAVDRWLEYCELEGLAGMEGEVRIELNVVSLRNGLSPSKLLSVLQTVKHEASRRGFDGSFS